MKLAARLPIAVVAALAAAGDPAGAGLAPLPPEGRPTEPRDLRGGRHAPVMDEDGVVFRLDAPDAREVSLVGSFNDWQEGATPMRRARCGVWSAAVPLESGRWPYLFAVDGDWIRDPDNPALGVPSGEEAAGLGETSLVQVRRRRVVVPEPHGAHDGRVGLHGSYDRVDQVALFAEAAYESRTRPLPGLRIGAGWSWGRERLLYDAAVTQPVFEEGGVSLSAEAYRRTATPDEFRVGALENTLGALFLREDWRDYHESEGFTAAARAGTGERVALEARWRDEAHRSVAKTTDWGLFGGDKRMRANDPIDEGDLRAMSVAWTFDSRNDEQNPTRGWLARAGWEWAGGRLGGDFRFRRGTAEVRRYLKLSPRHHFDLRLLGGLLEDAERRGGEGVLRGFDAVPVQERFYLGGIGTMRATQFKSLRGDRVALANAELRVDVFRDFQAAVFGDVGDAWVDAAEKADLSTDAGIGFQDADSNFRLNVAKKMDARDGDDLYLSARIRRMF
jgi:hypothetical protein